MKTPDEIFALADEHWVGTQEELEEVLELFYNDIRSSFESALEYELKEHANHASILHETVTTVDDYIYNHYF